MKTNTLWRIDIELVWEDMTQAKSQLWIDEIQSEEMKQSQEKHKNRLEATNEKNELTGTIDRRNHKNE